MVNVVGGTSSLEVLSELPVDWQTIPPKVHQIPSGCCVIECDASHKNGVTGTSAIIRLRGKEHGPFECTARSKGPIHAELTAVHKALLTLRRVRGTQRIHTLILYTDCLYASKFLESAWTPRRPYMKEILSTIAGSLYEIDDGNLRMIVCHTRSKYIGRIDRRAMKKRKEEELKLRARIAERVAKIEAAIVRGREIHVYEEGGQYFAFPRTNGSPPGFEVSLNPPSCGCSWWRHNWAAKGMVAINARALPCKHMCAVAEHLRLDVYQIFAHQIERVD